MIKEGKQAVVKAPLDAAVKEPAAAQTCSAVRGKPVIAVLRQPSKQSAYETEKQAQVKDAGLRTMEGQTPYTAASPSEAQYKGVEYRQAVSCRQNVPVIKEQRCRRVAEDVTLQKLFDEIKTKMKFRAYMALRPDRE